jgi:Domain of unknown function (DUF3303)
MLFHIKQTHAPQDCPLGKGGARSLFDGDSQHVKIHGFWLAFPQHTTYLVVETDEIVHLQEFLKPGAGVAVAEVTPVSDQPVPLPG